MQQWVDASDHERRIPDLRHEELSLHSEIANIDRKLVGSPTAVSLALRDARRREFAVVEAKLNAVGGAAKSQTATDRR